MFRLHHLLILPIFLTLHPSNTVKLLSKRHALRNPKRLWPNATVPYVLDTAYSNKQRLKIKDAMQLIMKISCIRFTPRKSEAGYMTVRKAKGCSARLGYHPNIRRVNLGLNCLWTSRILHELMHILGFYHEQNRPDRDEYVTVFTNNIVPKFRSNFKKSNPQVITTLNLPYDYYSILHYNNNGFARNSSLKTLAPKQKIAGKLGMGKTLTQLDIAKLNRLYNCPSSNNPNEVLS